MTLQHFFLLLLLLYHLLLDFVAGRSVNVTVDDLYPDPLTGATLIYAPTDGWSINKCAQCVAKLDPALAYNGTWHDAMFDPTSSKKNEVQTASFQFNGSAIYVYGILSLSNEGQNGTTDISFFIDNQPTGKFKFTPPGESAYNYNVLLYSNTSISSGAHTFVLQNGRPGGKTSLVLLDYLMYTRDDGMGSSGNHTFTHMTSLADHGSGKSGGGHSSHSSSVRTIVIICAVSLSIVLLIVTLVLLYTCRRHIFKRAGSAEKVKGFSQLESPSTEAIPYTYRIDTGPRIIPETKAQGRQPWSPPSPSEAPQSDSTSLSPVQLPQPVRLISGAHVVYPWRSQSELPPPYEASPSRRGSR